METTMSLSAAAEKFLAGPLLAEVDDGARLALFRALREEPGAIGTPLIEQGKANGRLWFLLDGAVTVVHRVGEAEQAIARIEAPGIFGATSFFRPVASTVTIRAATGLAILSLDHAGHDRLRRDEPRAAEALALATVRSLAERFDRLDLHVAEGLAPGGRGPRAASEWATFRARLFEEPAII